MNPLTAEIATAQNSDNKLILIIGGPGSGKSKLIHDYSNETGIPILNLDRSGFICSSIIKNLL